MLSKEEIAAMADTPLLTRKPVIYAANLSEAELADPCSNPHYRKLAGLAAEQGAEIMPISAAIESELAELESDEKTAFLEELGIEESGLDRLIRASYRLLGLISYFYRRSERGSRLDDKARNQSTSGGRQDSQRL